MALPHDDQELLSRSLHFCHGELLENPKAQDSLKQLGLGEAWLLGTLEVGWASGNLLRMFPEDEAIMAAAKVLGFLDAQGRDRFTNHLTLPLRSLKGHLTGYGAIDLETGAETLTLFEPFGCLYPQEIQKAKRVCLATSALDALFLAQLGEKAMLVAPAHEVARHLARLSEFSIREVILAFNDNELVTHCAQMLSSHGIEPLSFSLAPGKKLRELLKAGVELGELLKRAAPVSIQTVKPQMEYSEEGLHFTWPDRSYRVRFLEPNRFDHLKVSIKLVKDHRWHLDSMDLGLSKQRQSFIHMAKKLVRLDPAVLYQDLLMITEEVERHQADRILHAKQQAEAISEEGKREAESFLDDPHLFDRLAEDLKALGWNADPRCAIIGYLGLVSRKLERPLAIAWLEEQEPIGLASLLLPLLPEEDLVYLTRPSPKALFYQEEEALVSRVIAAEAHALSSEMMSCLLKLARGQALHAQVVIRDPDSGRLKTTAHRVKGPCALFLTVPTHWSGSFGKLPGAPFLPLRVPEQLSADEQLAWAASQEGITHLELQRQREKIILRHRTVQRFLRPLAVVNPHAEELLSKEREPLRYLRITGLARAIACLRQHQKSVQFERGREYVEVDEADMALAVKLSEALSDGGWPPPHGPSQRVLEKIRRQLSADPHGSFTRAQVRAWTGLGEAAVREYLERLEAEGYLERLDGDEVGRAFQYRLSDLVQPRTSNPTRTRSKREVPASQHQEEFDVVENGPHLAPFAARNGDG